MKTYYLDCFYWQHVVVDGNINKISNLMIIVRELYILKYIFQIYYVFNSYFSNYVFKFLEEYMTEPTDGNNGFLDHKIRFFVVDMK